MDKKEHVHWRPTGLMAIAMESKYLEVLIVPDDRAATGKTALSQNGL